MTKGISPDLVALLEKCLDVRRLELAAAEARLDGIQRLLRVAWEISSCSEIPSNCDTGG